MQINYTGHNLEVTPSLRNYAQEKLEKLGHHFDKISTINVIFNIEKLAQIVEATIFVSKGELHAKAEAEDMYAAIDGLMEKLDRQLIKHKEKLRSHHN